MKKALLFLLLAAGSMHAAEGQKAAGQRGSRVRCSVEVLNPAARFVMLTVGANTYAGIVKENGDVVVEDGGSGEQTVVATIPAHILDGLFDKPTVDSSAAGAGAAASSSGDAQ